MPCLACNSRDRGLLAEFPHKKLELETYIDALELPPDLESRRGYLIQCLHKAQAIFGYLPLEVQEFVGEKLRLQQSDVYGVISFYSYFTDKPVGKYKINVCTGTACFVKGAGKILEEFHQALKIDQGETTPDMKFSLGGIRCLGACSLAPVVMVNDRVYANVTQKMVARILKDCE
jgi:NADH-quinone oxidoreductase subunit E